MPDKTTNTIQRIKADVEQLKNIIKETVQPIDHTTRVQKTNDIIKQIRHDVHTLQQIIEATLVT